MINIFDAIHDEDCCVGNKKKGLDDKICATSKSRSAFMLRSVSAATTANNLSAYGMTTHYANFRNTCHQNYFTPAANAKKIFV